MADTATAPLVPQNGNGMPVTLDRAVHALEVSLTTAETAVDILTVRNQADYTRAVAAALQLREHEVKFAGIISDAERKIAQTVPRRKPGPKPKNAPPDNSYSVEAEIPAKTVANIKAAHGGLTDQQYTELKERTEQAGEPMSRRKVLAEANRLKKRDKQSADNGNNRQKPAEKPERLNPLTEARNAVVALELLLQAEKDKVVDLEERLALTELDIKIESKWRQYQRTIKALRGQVAEWQGKANAAEEAARLRLRYIKKLKQQVIDLGGTVEG